MQVSRARRLRRTMVRGDAIAELDGRLGRGNLRVRGRSRPLLTEAEKPRIRCRSSDAAWPLTCANAGSQASGAAVGPHETRPSLRLRHSHYCFSGETLPSSPTRLRVGVSRHPGAVHLLIGLYPAPAQGSECEFMEAPLALPRLYFVCARRSRAVRRAAKENAVWSETVSTGWPINSSILASL